MVSIEARILDDPRIKGITDPREREKVLLRFLASARASFHFERVYRLIYGSQIEALKYLVSRGAGGIPKTELKPLYDAAAQSYPLIYPKVTFDDWVRFLQTTGLIDVDPQGNVVRLSLSGREFLKHLVDMGYSEDNIG